MVRVLYIQASPLLDISYSIRVCDEFLEAYRVRNPGDEIVTLNVFRDEIPPFDEPAVRGKYAIMHGKPHSAQELQAWRAVQETIRQFTAADKYVLAVPMWNFGIPYRFKQYIDVIVQPTYTFDYVPGQGYRGLLTDRKAFVAYARGGDYGEDGAFDFQKKYVETILEFMGIADRRSVIVQPTLAGGPEEAGRKLQAAIAEAKRMAEGF
ncbi:MAG TPA: NAD(P)H-dependent oxidoreductase [Planctomycetota bacterium]|nr:NAD(P)H-dependent oxidoreductase [Planctomycetota bacterium]